MDCKSGYVDVSIFGVMLVEGCGGILDALSYQVCMLRLLKLIVSNNLVRRAVLKGSCPGALISYFGQ